MNRDALSIQIMIASEQLKKSAERIDELEKALFILISDIEWIGGNTAKKVPQSLVVKAKALKESCLGGAK